jgi:hypothetical protein
MNPTFLLVRMLGVAWRGVAFQVYIPTIVSSTFYW